MASVLQGRTIVMSGGSRGIGLAILVVLAETDQPDPLDTVVDPIDGAPS